MRHLGFILLASLALVSGRVWKASNTPTTLFNQEIFDAQKATFTYISRIDDASDADIIVDFGKPIGNPVTVPCGESRTCVNWTMGSKIVAQLIRTVDTPTWTTVTVRGPSHSYVFSTKGVQLYGGPLNDIYPSNNNIKVNTPYVTSEGAHPTKYNAGNVIERVWYTSGGRGIRVSEETPLFIDVNNETLTLSARNELPYPTNKTIVTSQIRIVQEENVKKAWIAMNVDMKKPSPPEVSVRKPTISTWVGLGRDISQEKMIEFAKTLKNKNLDIGIIEMDDGWETCWGSQIFDRSKFPNPKEMVDQLHKMGYTVTLWVHPFVNVECEAHNRLKDYLIKYDDGTPLTVGWWNGQGGMIDFLNPEAVEFFTNHLKSLQEDYDLDGFKFDAGEVSYLYGINENITLEHPNEWTKSYVEVAARFGMLGEVRVGDGTADATIRQRLQDLNTVWTADGHGLAGVIPDMLALTVSGYPATIPDMIGGNEYGEQADKEIFIRWTQLNTFLPVMQFSILPWKFDNETLEITRKAIALHEEYSPYMMDLYYDTGLLPVVSPLWMIEPTTLEALTCNDEFLVGDQILVAPVVVKGAVARDVYFPSGVWKDMETQMIYEGPKTVKNFPAPLDKLPWFVRQRFATIL